MYLGRAAKFTTKIHADVLVGSIAGAAMGGKPAVDEFQGRVLAGFSRTVEIATVVISDEDVTGLTVNASETLKA